MTDYAEKLEKRIKANWKTAFWAVIVVGLVAHMYKFTNTLLNHDSLFSIYSKMNMSSSGRWFLLPACGLSSYYDLPWLNGVLSLIYAAMTAAVIADIFDIKEKHILILSGALLISFPSITNTFFYEFTADGYMLAMLLAALAVRFSMIGDNKPWHLLVAVLCICFSCGIYQAYVSFALLLALGHFMWEILNNRHENKDYYRWILRQVLVFAFGMLAYYIIWKLCLHFGGGSAGSYLGLDSLGQESAGFMALILGGIKSTARGLANFFLGRNVFKYGWTLYAVLNVVFLLTSAAVLITAVIKEKLYKRPAHFVLFLLCIIATPIFAFIWNFVRVSGSYHLVMLQSLSIIYIFTLILSQKYLKKSPRALAALLFAVLAFKFTVQANVCYFEMDKSAERTRTMATEIVTRVHELDEGNVEKFAIVGGKEVSLASLNQEKSGEIMVNAHQITDNLIFDHPHGGAYLTEISGIGYPGVSEAELGELENSPQVMDMPTWPHKGSVAVIDNVAVIKLS